MARFVFTSHAAMGHIDFGGGSYLRTARLLIDRGHSVRWLLPANPRPGPGVFERLARVEAAIADAGVPVSRQGDPFDVNRPFHSQQVETVRAFSQFLREEAADACIVDRLSVLAGIGAHCAKVPWAVVGGDGTQWVRRPGWGGEHGVFTETPAVGVLRQLGVADFPIASVMTYWAVSPYLNVSFFPREFYGVAQDARSHFVGGSAPMASEACASILVTLGNSYRPEVRDQLLSSLPSVVSPERAPIEILTGDAAISARLRAASDRLRVLDWEPYDVAFARSRIAVGHGGSAFLWHAFAAGVPVIAIPSGVGDQSFGAGRVELLGLGRSIPPRMLTATKLGTVIDEILRDDAMRSRVAGFRRLLHSGGGVAAAAELFERLARERTAVTGCVAPTCCCDDGSGTPAR